MKLKNIAVAASAALLLASTSAAQATSAQKLSLTTVERVGSDAGKSNEQLGPINPLFIVLGLIGVVAVLEITGAIDLFESDSN